MQNLDLLLRKLQTSKDEIDLVSAKLSPGEKWRIGHPTEILRALEAKLPPEWNDWEPTLLFKKVEGTFGTLNEVTRQKILAIQACVSTNLPWMDYDTFENVCLAFCGQIPIWGTIEPLDLHEIMFGVGVLRMIREEEEFGDEIHGYMAATLAYNSLFACPPALPPEVQTIIDRISPETRELGREALDTWNKGVRVEDTTSEPNDAFEAQLQKLQMSDEWYRLGKDFDVFSLQHT